MMTDYEWENEEKELEEWDNIDLDEDDDLWLDDDDF